MTELAQRGHRSYYLTLNVINYMALDQHAANLVNLTKKAFGGDANSISIMDGISLIDSWTSFLKTDSSAGKDVLAGLEELRRELTKSSADATQVQHILQNLSQQTAKLAGTVDADDQSTLTTLADSLHNLSQQVGGTGHPAPTGGEAPMTSTVGGESSRSGTGASALDDDGDDLSDRQGGTRDDADNMDDTTGSDGGIRAGEAEGDSAYSPQTDNSSQGKPSRSDSSRVSGMGVSGGTADSDSSQSEGRSQY